MNTATCHFLGALAFGFLVLLGASTATPEITFSADVEKRQFQFRVRNSGDSPCYFRTHADDDWFYTIEIWDIFGRGYRLATKAQHEANEAGAFLGDWGDILINPGEKRHFTVPWNDLAAGQEVLQAVQKLLSDKNHYRSYVAARLIVIYRNTKEDQEENRIYKELKRLGGEGK
ncbi:MAG: hypothetical protein AAGI48_13380 [Verrucomicrobiota bacterium]